MKTLDTVEAIVEEFRVKFVSENSDEDLDYHEMFKPSISATNVEEWLIEKLTQLMETFLTIEKRISGLLLGLKIR